MTYRIVIRENANDDLNWFRRNDKKSYIKCFDLIRELLIHPREGTGRPERLRYFEEEVYSRRINLEDRLIYTINDDVGEIDISSLQRAL